MFCGQHVLAIKSSLMFSFKEQTKQKQDNSKKESIPQSDPLTT